MYIFKATDLARDCTRIESRTRYSLALAPKRLLCHILAVWELSFNEASMSWPETETQECADRGFSLTPKKRIPSQHHTRTTQWNMTAAQLQILAVVALVPLQKGDGLTRPREQPRPGNWQEAKVLYGNISSMFCTHFCVNHRLFAQSDT